MTRWNPNMDEAPRHTEVLVYRADAGVMLGTCTHMADWLVDENTDLDALGLTEDDIWEEVWWSFDKGGVSRLSDHGGDPTHWMPLPQPPSNGETEPGESQ